MNANRHSPPALALALAAIAIAAQIANAKGDPLADLATLLERQPNFATNAYALPNAALLPDMAALRKSIDSPEIRMAIEEYALATVLAEKGYAMMREAKAKLNITRETKIESVCIKTCNHGGSDQGGGERCRKCGGSGRCVGRCSLRLRSGTGNGIYKRYLVASGADLKRYIGAHGGCAAERGISRDEAVSRYNRGCGGKLHRDGQGTFYVEICPDCGGSARCKACDGSGMAKSKVKTVSCPRCNDTGKLADRAAATRMLAFFDKWLRGKTAGYALGSKVGKAICRTGGNSLKCDGVAVSHDGKAYVAVPVAILVANSDLRIANATGASLPLGDISVATREGAAFIEVLGKVTSVPFAETAFSPRSGDDGWIVIRNPTNDSPSVVKFDPGGGISSDKQEGNLLEGACLAGTPIVKTNGGFAGMLAEDRPRAIGDKGRGIRAKPGTVIPVDAIVFAGAQKLQMEEFKRQNMLLTNGETQFINASNLLGRAEEAFAAEKPYSLASDFPNKLEALTTSLSGETKWCIPEMSEFASKIVSQARMLTVRQKILEGEYNALAAKMAEAEREAARAEEARRAKAPTKSGFRLWMILLALAVLLLGGGLFLLSSTSRHGREQP